MKEEHFARAHPSLSTKFYPCLTQRAHLWKHRTERGENTTFVRVVLHSDLLIFACGFAPLCETIGLLRVRNSIISCFFLAISQKSHWAENKHWVKRWDIKRRKKIMHWSLKTAFRSQVFQATSGSGRLFLSVLIVKYKRVKYYIQCQYWAVLLY